MDHISEEDRQKIIAAVKQAAISLGAMWDEMNKHETDKFIFDETISMVEELAAAGDPQDKDIWESVQTRIRRV